MSVVVATAKAPSVLGNLDLGALLTFTADATASTSTPIQQNIVGCGIKLVIDITAITGTAPTLTVTLKGFDPGSGKSYTILASAALNATGTTVLTVYPGQTAAANLAANDHLPASWLVTAAIGGTTPAVTATISACMLT
jgi:hypothetical protein